MKKISILTFIAAFIAITSSAQINKKDILIGGTFGFNTNSPSSGTSSSNAGIYPRIGYAIGNNSVLSARLGFGYGSSKSEPMVTRYKSYSFNAGLSWKKYYSFNEKLGWYTDLFGSYNSGSSKSENINTPSNTVKTTSKGYSAGLNPGIYFIPVQGIIIGADVGGLGYYYSKDQNMSYASRNSGFSASFLSSFNFGIDFIINRKKK